MTRLSIIAIYLLTLYVYNCEDIKLFQSNRVLSEECQTQISDKEKKCNENISLEWECTLNTTRKRLSLECKTLVQKCCALQRITECVRLIVEELCGEDMMDRYVEHSRYMNSCPQQYGYGSEVCAQTLRHLPDIKQCYEVITPKDKQCLRRAENDWNCIPDCGNDLKLICCSRWQSYDCTTAEAKQDCDDFVFNEVIIPSVANQIKFLGQFSCRNYTYGSIQCQNQTIITSSTKSDVTVNVVTTASVTEVSVTRSVTISDGTDTESDSPITTLTRNTTPHVITDNTLPVISFTPKKHETTTSVTKVSVTPSQNKPNGTDTVSDSTPSTLTHNTTPHVIIHNTLPVITFTPKKHKTTKKSEQKKRWIIVIIVVVILLLLIIIGAILVICCGLCKTRKKSEDITETQQSEHNQQNNGETGEEEGKSAEESTTLRTNNSSSVVASDNESDSQLDQTVK